MIGLSPHRGAYRRRYIYRRARPLIVTPQSTPGCIVFPFDKVNHKFRSSNYTAAQTQGRVTHAEINKLLNEISVPVSIYYKDVSERREFQFWIRLCFLIFFPLLLVFLCYRSCVLNEARETLKKVRETVKQMIITNGSSYTTRGFIWNIPAHFPQWIELKDRNLHFNKTQPNSAGGKKVAVRPPAQAKPQAFPMQIGGYYQPNVEIQMVTMQQQQQSYAWNNSASGGQLDYTTVSYQPSGYPLMQQQGNRVVVSNQNQLYGANYYG